MREGNGPCVTLLTAHQADNAFERETVIAYMCPQSPGDGGRFRFLQCAGGAAAGTVAAKAACAIFEFDLGIAGIREQDNAFAAGVPAVAAAVTQRQEPVLRCRPWRTHDRFTAPVIPSQKPTPACVQRMTCHVSRVSNL